ncbi:MAG TPA: pyridoxal phosphate-dependent aminotransferase family protein [Gemmatimonadales bacterium]|nr:pyridoxal phosphate-dependent aminotransferase family protein [Gemmatimonadales bacterium]
MGTETLQHIALFDKCKNFTRARDIQAAGLYPYFKPISQSEDTVVVIEGKERIMMGSNNYLGLTHHPAVLAAAKAALERYGSGCTGSRFLNGTIDLHEQLETELAVFFGKEACLVFSTGYQANLGLISGLVGRGDLVFLDKLDHASIVDGAKMSHGDTVRFNHGDMAGLERKLQKVPEGTGTMVIVDGIYSMEGDIADVPALLKVTQKYGAALAIDDAHSVGVLGPNGDGTAAHFGLVDEVDIIAGTFSKSLASIGGFAVGTETVIHYLRHHARPMIFTAALPPSNTAGVLAALRVLQQEPERREQLWKNTRHLAEGLRGLGFDIGPTETPIIPVLIGPLEKTFIFWRKLFDAGVFTNPVVPPAVPPSQCRLRTSLMATHSADQIDLALTVFGQLGKELGVI